MGLWSTIKGWLNIGGVKVTLEGVPSTVSKAGGEIRGETVLTSKGDKHVLRVDYQFVLEKTTGRGDDKKTEEIVLGRAAMTEPFDIKTGETRTLDFVIPYSIEKTLKDMGGVLGAVGKLGAFAAKERLRYLVKATCDVKGTAFDPSDRTEVQVVD